MKQILCKYIREKTKLQARIIYTKSGNYCSIIEKIPGKIIGCVLAIENNTVGWSLLHKDDRLNTNNLVHHSIQEYNNSLIKQTAYGMALNRAIAFEEMLDEEKQEYLNKVPHSIRKEFETMQFRSKKYFK